MKTISMKNLWDGILRTVRRKTPEILTGLGIGGMITTTVLAVKATPEAMRRIERTRKLKKKAELTAKETVQAAWKCYILPVGTGAASIVCLISSTAVSNRRNAALATMASIAKASLNEYRAKVIETIGEKKNNAILDSIDREKVENDPPPKQLTAPTVASLAQPVLCYDSMFGRYFYSDMETLKKVENRLNYNMTHMSEPYISLNEFYEEINSPQLGPVDVGDELGWRSDRGLIELRFSSQLVDGRPCLVVSHLNPPEYGYDRV